VGGGTAKVDKTTFGEQDNVTTVLHEEAVDLRLDVLNGFRVGFDPSYVDFNVEVTNV